MSKRNTNTLMVIVAGIAGMLAAPLPTYAAGADVNLCEVNPEPLKGSDPSSFCGGGGTGGGGGGTTPPPPPPPAPTYTLQGVIQNEGYESNAYGRRLRIRAYSRFANQNNNRVDADYINVRCTAFDQLGGSTTDYDSENNGALVDVHFNSNFVYGAFRTITVSCTHNARNGAITYDSTSTTQINIPY